MSTSIFTKIIRGEISSYKIYEDSNYFAFLDINPLAKGHTLVIPKKKIDYIFDMDDEQLSGLILVSKHIAKAIKKSVSCKKVGIMVAGLEVPHAHIHLIPINSIDELNFARPKLKFTEEQFKEITAQIRSNL